VPVGIRAPDNPPRSLVTIPTVPPLLPLKFETQIKITKLHISSTLTATVICDGTVRITHTAHVQGMQSFIWRKEKRPVGET
jgi:hypothetical protein